MENDDMPMPRPPDKPGALFAEGDAKMREFMPGLAGKVDGLEFKQGE